MKRSYIAAAFRSAVAPRGGGLSHLDLHQLGAPVMLACLERAGLGPQDVDEVIVGNALGAGGNPARLLALAAGLPQTVAGLTIDRQCCSGLDAILLADALIVSGRAEVILAGGVESYSRRPLRQKTFTNGAPPLPYDRPPFAPWADRDPEMADAADALAQALGITRRAQDDWAVHSHQKARLAQDRMRDEIVEIDGVGQDSFTRDLTQGLCARAGRISGDITTANTSVAADAAAFCLVVSDRIAQRLTGPMAAIAGGATLGDRPERPGIAPVAAIKKALARAGLSPDDLIAAEIMEAFAAQAIACVTGAAINPAIANLGGGSLARGHPIGASGAINAVRLFHQMTGRQGSGVAAIAAAGGLGTALVLTV